MSKDILNLSIAIFFLTFAAILCLGGAQIGKNTGAIRNFRCNSN
jgi:hypothetical protein